MELNLKYIFAREHHIKYISCTESEMIIDLCYSNLMRTSLTSGNDEPLGNDIWCGSHMTLYDQPLFGECSTSSSHRLHPPDKSGTSVTILWNRDVCTCRW